MARPQKQTVDYFPHDAYAATGTTLTILQHEFGNDGYAFWFKLLELLARTPGHVFDCRNSARWGFLRAITLTTENQARNILSRLAELDAIESDLWQSDIIFCQNFVQRVSEVYKNRHQDLPQKPVLLPNNMSVGAISTPDNPTPEGVSTLQNPHTKLKETKVNTPLPPTPPPPGLSPPIEGLGGSEVLTSDLATQGNEETGLEEPWQDLNLPTGKPHILEVSTPPDPDLAEISTAYENAIGLLVPASAAILQDALKTYKKMWILDAIEIAVIQNKRKWSYCAAILERWTAEGKNNGTGRKVPPKEKAVADYIKTNQI